MLRFECDYGEGAHPKILERLLGLTPDGIDLLDGLRAAPGVEV